MNKLLENKIFISCIFLLFGIISILLIVEIIMALHQPAKKVLAHKIVIKETPTPPIATQSALPANMAAFTFKDNHLFIRYKNITYAEDDQTQNPQKVVFPDQDKYNWTALLEGPKIDDEIAFNEVFSLKQVPNSRKFFFIMRWDRYLMASSSGGQEVKTFYYDDTKSQEKLSLLFSHIVMKNKLEYNFTKIGSISSDGKYVAFNEYQCWGCPVEPPETVVVNLKTNIEKNIGKVSYFAWKENGNYEYKDDNPISCGEGSGDDCTTDDTENQPIKTGTIK